jgi:hypothetical protein
VQITFNSQARALGCKSRANRLYVYLGSHIKQQLIMLQKVWITGQILHSMQFVEYIWKLRSWIAGLGYVSHLHNLKVKDNGGSTKARTNPTETFFPVGKRKKRNAEKNLIWMVSRPKSALHISETQLPLVRIASLLVGCFSTKLI